MKNPESQNKENTLASLATLLREAFAMAATSNFPLGMAARPWKIESLNKLSDPAAEYRAA